MSTATSNATAVTSDPRIPFPAVTEGTACRARPELWFPKSYGDSSIECHRAKIVCKRCPVAEQCLLWALANPELTEHGIWAATSPKKRTHLRRALRESLGKDWVAVVATRREARTNARAAQRWNPRLQAAADPSAAAAPPAPAGPRRREPVTPQQATRNRMALLAAVMPERRRAA